MYISTPPSLEVENFQMMKIYYPAGDRTPDLLNQRQKCYHLSQRSISSGTISSRGLKFLQVTESSKYYMHIQMAVARGLGFPAGQQAGHYTHAASKHSICYFSLFSE